MERLLASRTNLQVTGDLGQRWKQRSSKMRTVCNARESSSESSFFVNRDEPSSNNLQSWQLDKLEEYAGQGKKSVEVKTICEETGVPRQAVLNYMKAVRNGKTPSRPATPSWRDSPGENNNTNSNSSRARPQPHTNWGPNRIVRARNPTQEGTFNDFSHEKQMPAKPKAPAGKRLGRAAGATLESVFLQHNHPNDAIIEGIVTLHKMSRKQVLEWFIERRRIASDGDSLKERSSQRHQRPSTGRKGRY